MFPASVPNLVVTVASPLLWMASLVVFSCHLQRGKGLDRTFRLLLLVLALDAGRGVIEAAYFGALRLGAVGHGSGNIVAAAMTPPGLGLLPGLVDLVAACAMLLVLGRLWLPNEIRQRRQMVRQAWETGLRLQRLLHHSPNAILVYQDDGRLLEVNDVACDRLGYNRDELLSKNVGEIALPKAGTQTKEIQRRLAEGEVLHLEELHRRRDGSTFPVETSMAAMKGEDGKSVITALCRDLSTAAPAQRLTAPSERLIESASYKLRTPLNTILGLSEMISGGICGPIENAKINEYLADIHASGLDLLKVIDNLSSLAAVEAAMGSEQQSYRTIIEMSPDTICLCREGIVTFVNAAGVRLLGSPHASHIEGTAFRNFVHADYQVLCDDNFGPLIGESAATPMKFISPTGKSVDVLVSAAAAPQRDGTVLVLVRNISELTRATRDTAAQLKRLNSILDTAVDAILVCDETGRIETFNRSAEAMFGYGAPEAMGQPVEILMTPVDAAEHQQRIERYLASRHASGIGMGREVTARRKDGTIFPAEISLSVCHLDDRTLFTAMVRDVTERRNFEDYLAHSATHDMLTGLPNRRLLQDRLLQAVERAEADHTMVAVWFIDLDGFKTVNDVMGHSAGDELLIEAGQRMAGSLKPSDTVARFGGDEFTLIITGVHRRDQIVQAMEDFLQSISRPFTLRGREVTLTANIGIALYPDHSRVPSDLITHASAAMMFAKATGRNLFRFFDPVMHSQSVERLTLENELRRGIERGELIVHYQPQVEVATGRIVGLEALVRWKHPQLGMVLPSRFISIAEQTGLIVPLGEWVLRQACQDLRRLEEMGFQDVTVGVNISAKQFGDVDVLALIQSAIDDTGINPRHLDVEITESTLMNDPENVVGYLDRMSALGIKLSIDDFGTGYSSLNYLKRFPVNTLKIDQSFVVDIADNPKDEAIAVTIITLAHSMGMRALAEGVEFPKQMEILKDYGCDIIQGYLYSKPLALDAIIDRLQNNRTLTAVAG